MDWCEKGRQAVPGALGVLGDAAVSRCDVEEIKRRTYNTQNLVALPMKFSFLEGK